MLQFTQQMSIKVAKGPNWFLCKGCKTIATLYHAILPQEFIFPKIC